MATIVTAAAHSARRRPGVAMYIALAFDAWRQRRALKELDARARRDLGLSEADNRSESRRPLWDVPQTWLR